jgi:hypothetical protein
MTMLSAMAQCKYPGATLTSDIYWSAQPPAVRALRNSNGNVSPGDQQSKALALATQGYKIDVPIMVWGWNPVCMMGMRKDYGYTWVPSALQPNIVIAPGLSMPGVQAYDPKNPPPGSIIVSLDAKDYPPFDPPPVVVPVVNTKALVGACFDGSNICGLGPGAATSELRKAAGLTSGKTITENGVKYIFKSVDNPFGSSAWFEKQ